MRADASILRSLARALLALAALGAAACARGQELPEYRLKAAFLYNFASFTEWPAGTGDTLNLCVYGSDPFGTELDALEGKKVGTRVLAVLRKAQPEALRGCQVVFVPGAAIGQLPRLLEVLRGLPVLTVADTPGAAQRGAALNMILTHGRISFEANLLAARDARLVLSSRLLRLASEVVQ